ncbi:hypothetical protein NLU13_3992 [Sarocladium strictum]|uniref:Zn(2)-C6 fungal-type domain-containing protein n=1 Tax=Sarocladium strictum TaxID=5046 RepID=A0AA39GKL1_SARSR|nr:hypothetical protein NLU13_3992 [Sarocladium strictum]
MTASSSLRNHSGTAIPTAREKTVHGACEAGTRAICETSSTRSNLNQESQAGKPSAKGPRLRSACDGCHAAKTRCTGGNPCARCVREDVQCHYSYMSKLGKPKGSLNKKTIQRLQQFMTLEPPDCSQGQPHWQCANLSLQRRQQQRHPSRQSAASSERVNKDSTSANAGKPVSTADCPASTNSTTGGNTITVAPVETQIIVDPALNHVPISYSPVPSAVTASNSSCQVQQFQNTTSQTAGPSEKQPQTLGLNQPTENDAEASDVLLSAMLSPSMSLMSPNYDHLMGEDWSPSMTDYLDLLNENGGTAGHLDLNAAPREHDLANSQTNSHAEACFWTTPIQDKEATVEEASRPASSCSPRLALERVQAGLRDTAAPDIGQSSIGSKGDSVSIAQTVEKDSLGRSGSFGGVSAQAEQDQSDQSLAPSWRTESSFPLTAGRSLASEASSSSATSLGCNCFSSVSDCLCQLQDAGAGSGGGGGGAKARGAAGSRQAAQPIDVLLMRIQRSIPTVRSLLSCECCMHDSHCLLLANMVLARLLCWVQASVAEHSKGGTEADGDDEGKGQRELGREQQHWQNCRYRMLPAHVQLGTYTATRELGYRITRVLLQMHCAEVKRAASEFYRRAQQMDYDQPDRSYLLSKARHLQTELKWLTEEVCRTEDGMP